MKGKIVIHTLDVSGEYELAGCRSADAFHRYDANSDAYAGSYSYSVLHSSQTHPGQSIGQPTDFPA
jgi:hypothetical protein